MSAPREWSLGVGESRRLRHTARLVPRSSREEWSRFWSAELWHARHQREMGARDEAGLYAGMLRDALWLRTAHCNRALHGTAVLCLLLLGIGCVSAALLALVLRGGAHGLETQLASDYGLFVFAAPLVAVATFLTSTRHVANVGAPLAVSATARRGAFLLTKGLLHFIFAYFVSTDLCSPVAVLFPNTGAFFQMLLFVVISVCGLRWTFQDQDVRCKDCLRLLEEPARVGRRSHNLLEWNGTEARCRAGHGALTIPEHETSWHQSSQWSRQITAEARRVL